MALNVRNFAVFNKNVYMAIHYLCSLRWQKREAVATSPHKSATAQVVPIVFNKFFSYIVIS